MTNESCQILRPGIIVLAGGQSKRLGRPKQSLPFGENTLLEHTIQVAMESHTGPVSVVLGANADSLKQMIQKGVEIIVNPDWETGMSSTLRKGLTSMMKLFPELDGMFFLVCDQPFIDAFLLKNLLKKQQETGKAMVASAYENQLGTPALFSKKMFPELLNLQGDKGARKLLKAFPDEVEQIPFDKGIFDIDTEEDYQKLLAKQEGSF